MHVPKHSSRPEGVDSREPSQLAALAWAAAGCPAALLTATLQARHDVENVL